MVIFCGTGLNFNFYMVFLFVIFSFQKLFSFKTIKSKYRSLKRGKRVLVIFRVATIYRFLSVQYFGAHLDEDLKKNIDLIFEFCETTLKQECQETLEPRSIIIWTQQLLEVRKLTKLALFHL